MNADLNSKSLAGQLHVAELEVQTCLLKSDFCKNYRFKHTCNDYNTLENSKNQRMIFSCVGLHM